MKRVISFLLALGLLFLSTPVFASEFVDVPEDHWAYVYIKDLSDRKIITGYPEGKYLPNREVSYLEVLKLFREMLSPSPEEVSKALRDYGKVSDSFEVPEWAKESLCIALSRNIITERTLRQAKSYHLLVNAPKKVPDRYTVAVYLARALEMEGGDVSLLKYRDLDKIPKDIQRSLASLVAAGIFSPTGSDGSFEGNRGIRRGEMAKIIYLSEKFLAKRPKPEPQPEPVPVIDPTPAPESGPIPVPLKEEQVPVDETLKKEMEAFLWRQAVSAYSPYYDVLRYRVSDFTMLAPNEASLTFQLIMKNYYRDPDTVDYIKRAKEEGDPNYEKLKREYLAEKVFRYPLKVVKTEGHYEMYHNDSNTGTPLWNPATFEDFILKN